MKVSKNKKNEERVKKLMGGKIKMKMGGKKNLMWGR
jgi:hypothetical protein